MEHDSLKKVEYDKDLSTFDLGLNPYGVTDRLITKLTLDDYDWMKYTFETFLPTKEQGLLEVCVEYFGCVFSIMTVVKRGGESSVKYEYTFDTDIFKDFLIDFMRKHLDHWNNTYAFCGEQEAIMIYNKVLDNFTSVKIEEIG